MKIWDKKEESISSKYIKREKKPEKTIKDKIKFNFVPIIFISYALIILIILLAIFVISNLPENNGNEEEQNIVTMTAKQYFEQIKVDTDWSTFFRLKLQSLDEGQTLSINDSLSNISYSNEYNYSTITFSFYKSGFQESLSFDIEGNVSEEFNKFDKVNLTVNIIHKIFTYEGIEYDIEIFKQQWTSKDEFLLNFSPIIGKFGLPLPKNVLRKSQN